MTPTAGFQGLNTKNSLKLKVITYNLTNTYLILKNLLDNDRIFLKSVGRDRAVMFAKQKGIAIIGVYIKARLGLRYFAGPCLLPIFYRKLK